MIKKIFITALIFFVTSIAAFAEAQAPQATTAPSTPYTNSSSCYRMFAVPSEKLFYLTLAAIAENKYAINETQTREGYILFAAGNKEFLATTVNIDGKSSLLKITPADNSYYFSQAIVSNIFAYIVQNLESESAIYIKGK